MDRRGFVKALTGLQVGAWVLIAVGLGVLVGAFRPARAAVAFMVEPVLLELEVEPGSTYTASLSVIPAGPEAGQVAVDISDWLLDSGGNLRLLPPGAVPRSATRWLQLAPNALELSGGSSATVRLTLNVPAQGVAGAYWTMVLLRGAPVVDTRRPGVSVQVQVGVPVYVVVRGTERPRVELAGFEVEPPSGSSPGRAVVQIRNSGNVHARVAGQVELRDEQGEPVGRLELPQGLVLPGMTRRFQVELPKDLKPGLYVALATVATQKQELLVSEATFELPGPDS